MSHRLDRLATYVLAASALVIAVSAAYRTFVVAPVTVTSAEHVYSAGWEEGLTVGHTLGGNDEAPVKLIALMDLQCPACRAHHPTLTKLADTRPTDVQVIYVHFPLSYHEYAKAAARVAECAAAVGAFRQWTDFVFSQQDSLGLKTWEAMTAEAGIVDAPRVASCAENETPVPRIEAGLAYGDLVGLTGTPTLLINGWRYVRNPSEATLEADIARILDGGRL